MEYVVLRPYWNVPPSIQRSEIVPAVREGPRVHRQKGIRGDDAGRRTGDRRDDQRRSAGTIARRESGGAAEAGTDEFIGAGEADLPEPEQRLPAQHAGAQLFSQARRDFSHGCIRVEKPAEMTAWALRNEGWNVASVRDEMQKGKDNQQVNLAKPIPVLILYGTAVVDQGGRVQFFDDIYGADASLDKALNKGYPYLE